MGDDPENFGGVVQILDIIAKWRDLPLSYIGILMNCYEIIDVKKDLTPYPHFVYTHTSRTNDQSDNDSLDSEDSLDNLALHERHDRGLPDAARGHGPPWQLDNWSHYTFHIYTVPFPENKYPILSCGVWHCEFWACVFLNVCRLPLLLFGGLFDELRMYG